MTTSVNLNASPIGGTIIPGGAAPRITVPASGRITVPTADAPLYIAAGAQYVSTNARAQTFVSAPIAASAGHIVGSAAFSNGTLAIANQPDVPRQVAVRIDTGTSGITGGVVALSYLANDGTTQVDKVSAVAPASTLLTVASSKGVVVMNSVIVTGVAGGASPKVQVNDTNSLSVQVNPGFADFMIGSSLADGAADGQVAVASTAASYTPSTTPNGTHTFAANFSFTAP